MSRAKRLIFFWLPPVLWMGLIYFLSSFHKLQASPVSWQDFIIRKGAHFIEYAVLYFLFYRALRKLNNFTVKEILSIALVLTVVYALTDEYHQTLVFGRTGKVFDIGVDSLGAAFGLVFSWRLVHLLPKKIREVVL